jgi:hypothetical protein
MHKIIKRIGVSKGYRGTIINLVRVIEGFQKRKLVELIRDPSLTTSVLRVRFYLSENYLVITVEY